jgi:hypothetical protein
MLNYHGPAAVHEGEVAAHRASVLFCIALLAAESAAKLMADPETRTKLMYLLEAASAVVHGEHMPAAPEGVSWESGD